MVANLPEILTVVLLLLFVCWVAIIFVGLAVAPPGMSGVSELANWAVRLLLSSVRQSRIKARQMATCRSMPCCDSILRRGKGYSIRLRVCTHCGVPLNEESVNV
jgi:hypothetical protein